MQSLSAQKRILVLAAHPDDEVLGCGGILAKYQEEGHECSVLIIGEGSTCRFSSPDQNSDEAKAAIIERKAAAFEVKKTLGLGNLVIGDYPCGRLDQVPIIEINKLIEKQINDFKPDLVFTHSDTDTNNDHKVIHKATLIATRPGAMNFVSSVLCYETLSSTEWAFGNPFNPNYFVALEERHVDLKWRALSHYESETREFPFPRSSNGIFCQAKTRGMQAGVHYAEAFRLIRSIK